MSITSAPTSPAATPAPAAPPRDWNTLAAFLSYLVPGLGQISQGRIGKGILFFLCVYVLFFYGTVLGSGTGYAPDGKRYTITSCVYLPHTIDPHNPDRNNPLGLPTNLANLYNRPQFIGQFWIGIAAWPAIWQYTHSEWGKDAEPDSVFGTYQQTPSNEVINIVQTSNSKALDLGLVFTVIAGVLNVLVVYDALAGPALCANHFRAPRNMTIPPHNVYAVDLPLAVVLISLVYSAMRFDDWGPILREAFRWGLRLLGFLCGIGLVLYLVSLYGGIALVLSLVVFFAVSLLMVAIAKT